MPAIFRLFVAAPVVFTVACFSGPADVKPGPSAQPGPSASMAPPLPPMTTVPDFGCFAADTQQVACVVGQRGRNLGENTAVQLRFVPLGTAVVESISLVESTDQVDPGPDELPNAVTGQVAARLQGFAALDRNQPHINSSFSNGALLFGPPLALSQGTIRLAARPAADGAFATTLSLDRPGHPPLVIEESEKFTADLNVHVFPFGDNLVVEQIYAVADEGTSGTVGQVWRCDVSGCVAME